jgi:hypothetical protein
MGQFTRLVRKINLMLMKPQFSATGKKQQKPGGLEVVNKYETNQKAVQKVVQRILQQGRMEFCEKLQDDVYIKSDQSYIDLTSETLVEVMKKSKAQRNSLIKRTKSMKRLGGAEEGGKEAKAALLSSRYRIAITPLLLETIAELVDANFKQLVKINQNEYNVCSKINEWLDFDRNGHEPTKKIFLTQGNKTIKDKSCITVKSILEGMLVQEMHSVGPSYLFRVDF